MKIVISRKGFDSGFGGVPSPIGPNGEMISLPIPGGSNLKYTDLQSSLGNISDLVRSLTKGKMDGNEIAHLDPDLDYSALPRVKGWKPALGQTGAAQGHLDGQGVDVGDVFLFFGWFRPVIEKEGKFIFKPGSESFHALFGYLQIGEKILLGESPNTDQILKERPWLKNHPHIEGERDANNTLLIASDTLVLNGVDTGLPGASNFSTFSSELRLTAPNSAKSLWKVPAWMSPSQNGPSLSYHKDPSRWSNDGEDYYLQTVAKGQEFVMDVSNHPQANQWMLDVIKTGLSFNKDLKRKTRLNINELTEKVEKKKLKP